MYVSSTTSSGVSREQLNLFAPSSGAELSLEQTAPGGNADEQLAWLANVAFDRLFAIPIHRTA